MMGIETIKQMSREAGERAAREGKRPYLLDDGEIETLPPFPFPNLGSYVPDGWEEVERLFVDASGFGADWEPALTVEQFKDELREREGKGYGYAIVEAGQFQVYVGVFKRSAV